MDWIDRLSGILTTKALAATSALTTAGGMAAAQAPRLAEASLLQVGGYGVALPDLALLVAIASGLLSIFRPAIMAALRRFFR